MARTKVSVYSTGSARRGVDGVGWGMGSSLLDLERSDHRALLHLIIPFNYLPFFSKTGKVHGHLIFIERTLPCLAAIASLLCRFQTMHMVQTGS